MNYSRFAFSVLIVIGIYIGITKVRMWAANDVDEKLGENWDYEKRITNS